MPPLILRISKSGNFYGSTSTQSNAATSHKNKFESTDIIENPDKSLNPKHIAKLNQRDSEIAELPNISDTVNEITQTEFVTCYNRIFDDHVTNLCIKMGELLFFIYGGRRELRTTIRSHSKNHT